MERLIGEDIEEKAEIVNDMVQCARTSERLTAYLLNHVPPAVLLAVADLNHLDVHRGQRKGTIVAAIVRDRFGN